MKLKSSKLSSEDGAFKMNASQPSLFVRMMDMQSELRAECDLAPLPFWKRPTQTPKWSKNIYGQLRKTIMKSVLKLRPKKNQINWRNYGRSIGLMERYKTFLIKDAPQMIGELDLKNINEDKWNKIKAIFGEEDARKYCLKVLERPSTDSTSLFELALLALEKNLLILEKMKQTAFMHIIHQDAKTHHVFLKGMAEGYTMYLNTNGEFSGDDRRADVHFELLAWQYDIEKLRKLVLPINKKKTLFNEFKKLPEFKNKKQNWFDDVCKDVKLSFGQYGRPWQFSQL
jgi:hypothetical protein